MSKSGLGAAIAWRYLISKKSHSAVGAISVVSICGMAVATAAIICVLSVFNGFKGVIGNRVDSLSPDVLVTPEKGKTFANTDSVISILSGIRGIKKAIPALTDNALAIHDSREMPVTLKGIDIDEFRAITSLDSLIIDRSPYPSAPNRAILSIGAASRLSALPGEEILIFTPRRIGRVNLANPANSFLSDSVENIAVFRSDQKEIDENMIIVDIDLARELLQYDSEASAIEIQAQSGTDLPCLVSEISAKLGPAFVVKDRLRQQEMNFRMINIEKWVTFLLLFFILVIASFNIISSLSMLVLEKEKSLSTLTALGFSKKGIGRIFFWESIYVAGIGGISGIILGLLLSLLQQNYGLITIQGDPESLAVVAYPVTVDPKDILITMIPIILIALATAAITSSFARTRAGSAKLQ